MEHFDTDNLILGDLSHLDMGTKFIGSENPYIFKMAALGVVHFVIFVYSVITMFLGDGEDAIWPIREC